MPRPVSTSTCTVQSPAACAGLARCWPPMQLQWKAVSHLNSCTGPPYALARPDRNSASLWRSAPKPLAIVHQLQLINRMRLSFTTSSNRSPCLAVSTTLISARPVTPHAPSGICRKTTSGGGQKQDTTVNSTYKCREELPTMRSLYTPNTQQLGQQQSVLHHLMVHTAADAAHHGHQVSNNA
jgi:hypothetical protein